MTILATINAQLAITFYFETLLSVCPRKVGVRRVGDERHDDYSITADQRRRVRLDPRGNRFFLLPPPRGERGTKRLIVQLRLERTYGLLLTDSVTVLTGEITVSS